MEQDQTLHILKAIHDAKTPGASSWLSVLPLAEFGFALNEGKLRDALSLRYGRPLKGLFIYLFIYSFIYLFILIFKS